MTIDMVEGRSIEDRCGRHEDGVVMMRYWNEVFEDASGAIRSGTTLSSS